MGWLRPQSAHRSNYLRASSQIAHRSNYLRASSQSAHRSNYLRASSQSARRSRTTCVRPLKVHTGRTYRVASHVVRAKRGRTPTISSSSYNFVLISKKTTHLCSLPCPLHKFPDAFINPLFGSRLWGLFKQTKHGAKHFQWLRAGSNGAMGCIGERRAWGGSALVDV